MNTNEGKITFVLEQIHIISTEYSAIYSAMYLYCQLTLAKTLASNKCSDPMLYIDYNDLHFILDSTGRIPFIEEYKVCVVDILYHY